MVDQEQISEVMRELGRRGGSVTGVRKGFASLTPEQRKKIAAKGVAARKKGAGKKKLKKGAVK